jgi:hypothetical protein
VKVQKVKVSQYLKRPQSRKSKVGELCKEAYKGAKAYGQASKLNLRTRPKAENTR